MKSSTVFLPPLTSAKVLDQLRERIRYLHYSIRTEEVYVYWVRSFIRFHGLRHPATLSPDEVARLLCFLDGEHRLFAQLLYGTGMRINEGLQLRVKDMDFERRTIIVREGKGGKDRAVMLPQSLVQGLKEQLARAHLYWT